MGYLSELRINARSLWAAIVGLCSGYMLNYYLSGLFLPHLMKAFGWTKSQMALVGVIYLTTLLVHPIVGRLTDVFGVRRVAALGVVMCPLIYLAYGTMNGSFAWYFVLNMLQMALVGSTTATIVYPRLIATEFRSARGLALSIAAAAPVLTAAATAPLLSRYIDGHGWRAGYAALAAATAIGGIIALLLVPAARPGQNARAAMKSAPREYLAIVRNPAFRLIAIGLFLCNLTLQVQAPQLKLVLLDRGMSSEHATLMLSFYAVSIVVGRLCCGLALDRLPTHLVAPAGFGLPAIGLLLLASGTTDSTALVVAVATVGLSLGAELDITGYLLMKFFRPEIYSTVYSLMGILITVSAALGALFLSYTMHRSNSFSPFFYLSGALTILGCSAFALLRRLSSPPICPGRSELSVPSQPS